MKKILTVLLSMALLFSAASMASCDAGSDSDETENKQEQGDQPSDKNDDVEDAKDTEKEPDKKPSQTETRPSDSVPGSKETQKEPDQNMPSEKPPRPSENDKEDPPTQDSTGSGENNDPSQDPSEDPSQDPTDDPTDDPADDTEYFFVTFWANGNWVADIELPAGTREIDEPEVPEREGYTNGRWEEYTLNDTSISVYALYTPIEYTAYFKDGDVVLATRTFTVEDSWIEDMPDEPVKNGYTGRWGQYSIGAGDMDIQAIWSPRTYTITYAGINGAEHDNPTTFTPDDQAIVLSEPTREGSEFIGWYDESDSLVTTIEKGTIGDLTLTAKWNVLYTPGLAYTTLSDGTWSVSGTGTWDGGEIYIPSTYNGVAVTAIAESAFASNATITEVKIPDSVTTIGDRAFRYCRQLKTVDLGSGVTTIGRYAFDECTKLEKLTLSDIAAFAAIEFGGVAPEQSYQDNPLYWADALYLGDELVTELIIPEGVTRIGNGAFYEFKGTTISLPSTLESIGAYAFATATIGAVQIPGKTNDIGEYAFGWNDQLETVVIGEGVTRLPSLAFFYCENLTSVSLPDTLVYMEKNAFQYCDRAILNDHGVQYVDGWVVGSDSSITEATLRADTVGVSEEAFYQCRSLHTWNLPDGLRYINDRALGFAPLQVLVIPDSVLVIGEDAFNQCSGLRSITIGKGVTKLDFNMFSCGWVEELTLPFVGESRDSTTNTHIGYILGATTYETNKNISQTLKSVVITDATTIATNAFYGCETVENIVIPDTVTSIGVEAFKNTKALKSITLPFVGLEKETEVTQSFYKVFNQSAFAPIIPTTLTHVTILGGDHIDGNAFMDCESITHITLPATLERLDDLAFYRCSNLRVVNIADINAWCRITMREANTNPLIASPSARLYINGEPISGMVELEEGITNIPARTFNNSKGLIAVSLPSTLATIGESAFVGCDSLIEVQNHSALPISVGSSDYGLVAYYAQNVYDDNAGASKLDTSVPGYVFYADQDVVYLVDYTGEPTVVTLPADYQGRGYTIRDYTFIGRSDITSLDISSNASFGGYFALYDLIGLESLHLPYVGMTAADAEKLNPPAFYLGYLFGSTLDDCNEVVVPETLKTIVIKGGTTIPASAFAKCANVETITLPDEVKNIGYGVFEYCTSLKSFHVPQHVLSIGPRALTGCSSLESITAAPGATVDNAYTAAGNCLIIKGAVLFACKNSVIPTDGSVTSISLGAFYDCTELTSIVIPASVTVINESAFVGCTNLTSVTFENPTGWSAGSTALTEDLSDAAIAATCLKETYSTSKWTRTA